MVSLHALAILCLTAGASEDMSSWVNARLQEQGFFNKASSASSPLFREASPNSQLPAEFVPPMSLAPLVKQVRSGVVNLKTTNGKAARSLGSGFIVSPEGYVVTNHHVVDKALSMVVTLSDGRAFQGTVIGKDASTDVALVKLSGKEVGALPTVVLGDSDKLEVGEWVLAMGNPFGLGHSVSHGLISAKERVIGMGAFDDFIQTDVLINPGNSGGPLFNMRGEVVGVTTAVVKSGQGIGFAVPINMVKALIPNLLENGQLARGWLGAMVLETPDVSQPGAWVSQVVGNSPAARAGLSVGDRIIAVNGQKVTGYQDMLRKIALLAPGTETRLSISRSGKAGDVVVRLESRPDAVTASARDGRWARWGLAVQELSEELSQSLGAQATGVLVAAVYEQSPAALAGLKAGDVVLEVNRQPVADTQTFEALIEKAGNQTVLLRFQREKAIRYLAIRVSGK